MKLPQPFIEGSDNINAIVETPKGSRNKYAYDETTDLIKLKKALPAGMVFPFDFGFIPSTIAEDGDPMDILVLTDAPTFPGCLVESKVLGIIKVEQEEDGEKVRNDRVIAVQLQSRLYSSVNNIDELPEGLVKEIVNFFASYNQVSEDLFNPLGNDGPDVAIELINHSIKKATETNNC
ncbi:MAG: Inorganic diphosphatase [Segetibacter sp.]|jgi:inorganic pyrophosphatase|nr:Inorganic diphosphatase [Segetibacter sp.]